MENQSLPCNHADDDEEDDHDDLTRSAKPATQVRGEQLKSKASILTILTILTVTSIANVSGWKISKRPNPQTPTQRPKS